MRNQTVLILTLIAAANIAAATPEEEALKDIAAKWQAIKSISYEFTFSAISDSGGMHTEKSGTGSCCSVNDTKPRMRMTSSQTETTVVQRGTPLKRELSISCIQDESVMWQLEDVLLAGRHSKSCEKLKSKKWAELSRPRFTYATDAREKFSLEPDQTIDGNDCYVFKVALEKSAVVTLYYFDKQHGYLAKEVHQDNGKDVFVRTIRNVKIDDKDIPMEQFKFTPPEGVEVDDRTK